MDRFPKMFIKAGLIYLFLGALTGTLMALDWINPNTFRFVHLHAMLLGFMVMTIVGVAYHILPRFNGKPIPHANWLPVQFYIMNIGLIGMTILFVMGGYYDTGAKSVFFGVFALAVFISIVLFLVNIFPILGDPPPIIPPKAKPVQATSEDNRIAGDMKVSAVLDTWPEIVDVFTEHGFKTLANPVARAAFAKMITISNACKVHRVDEGKFLQALNVFIKDSDKTPPAVSAPKTPPPQTPEVVPPPPSSNGRDIKKGEKCTADVLIGKLIETYPGTKTIFAKHYGESCFSCPGQAFETIAQTASMHNTDLKMILDEINSAIDKELNH